MTDNKSSASESDNELFDGFLEECDEMLGLIETESAGLEFNHGELSRIDSIFRGVHTLKGNSSFFNFENVKTFCHTFENFLDLVREKKIEVDNDIVKFILEGSDHLKSIFNRLQAASGIDVVLNDEENGYLDRINKLAGPTSEEEKREALRKELLSYFDKTRELEGEEAYESSPIKEVYELINKYAPALVENKRKQEITGGSKWMRGDLDVTREYLSLKSIVENPDEDSASQFLSAVDSLIQKHTGAGDTDIVGELTALKDDFEMFYQDEIGIDEMLAESISAALVIYAEKLKEIPEEIKKEPFAGERGVSAPEERGERRRANFVRVEESLLDVFIDNVGELITLNELFDYLQKKVESNDLKGLAVNFRHTNQSFRELSQQLQKSLYEIRKAPVERALAKLPRLVRNIARASNKSIKLTSEGGETEVDKSMLDKIESFLVHLVRNSADHGIETIQERVAGGKKPEGEIRISVYSDKLSLFFEVADNGRGVDVESVRKVAVSRGFVSEEGASKFGEREALDLLLRPGFSTADKITETSGRGVGMDVLAASVHEMGGFIKLTNFPGEGLKINISIPLAYTTRVKLGLTLVVGSGIFLIPAENVRESFKAGENDVTLVEGRGEAVKRWERIYPVVRLHNLFGVKPIYKNIWDSICVLAESRGQTVCLIVDKILGQRQIVYKQLTVQTREPTVFDGVSILDESRMALILSVDGIVKQYHGKPT
ncbi:Signal transduction histidine kinase CheA [hydrothermal vent metagenome]|uniref:histidine kinase n=1 Tax=hydrothermal vent metagenome TaxID=652676 RepID=A0A3B1C5F8_9ZZZZ